MLRVVLIAISILVSTGASYRTRNFAVTATNAKEAKAVAEAAEKYRHRLAIFWIGQPLKHWRRPCTIDVRSGACGTAGQTTFQFVGGTVMNWKMMVQGSSERILDSVLPHEVNHTIFASYFRRPLPRWADEGASTLFEHSSEQRLQLELLEDVVRSRLEFIPLRKLLTMKHYPAGHRSMLVLYAEGFGLVDFLMQQGGRQTYLKFLNDARNGRWEAAIRKHYNHKGVDALETDWRSWVIAGMPRYGVSPEEMIATLGPETRHVAKTRADRPQSHTTAVRGQNPDQHASRYLHGTTIRQPMRGADSVQKQKPTVSDRNRRRTVQAPAPVQCSKSTKRQRDVDSMSKQPSATNDCRQQMVVVPLGDVPQLQPTYHQDQTFTWRQRAGTNLPWKRREESGSTPQWAGFPGQMGSF